VHNTIGSPSEGCVERAVAVQAADKAAGLAAQAGEAASHQQLPVTLNDERIDGVIGLRIERRVQHAIRIHTAQVAAGLTAQVTKSPAITTLPSV